MRDEDVVVETDFEGIVRGIAVVTLEEDMGGLGFGSDKVCEREEGHAFPGHVELSPGGNAMEVADIVELRKGEKLRPGKGDGVLHFAANFKFPTVERDLGSDA